MWYYLEEVQRMCTTRRHRRRDSAKIPSMFLRHYFWSDSRSVIHSVGFCCHFCPNGGWIVLETLPDSHNGLFQRFHQSSVESLLLSKRPGYICFGARTPEVNFRRSHFLWGRTSRLKAHGFTSTSCNLTSVPVHWLPARMYQSRRDLVELGKKKKTDYMLTMKSVKMREWWEKKRDYFG